MDRLTQIESAAELAKPPLLIWFASDNERSAFTPVSAYVSLLDPQTIRDMIACIRAADAMYADHTKCLVTEYEHKGRQVYVTARAALNPTSETGGEDGNG